MIAVGTRGCSPFMGEAFPAMSLKRVLETKLFVTATLVALVLDAIVSIHVPSKTSRVVTNLRLRRAAGDVHKTTYRLSWLDQP
jgi:hypothetical protein